MELSLLQRKGVEFYHCVGVTKVFIPHHPRHCGGVVWQEKPVIRSGNAPPGLPIQQKGVGISPSPTTPPILLLLLGAVVLVPGAEGQQRWAQDTALGKAGTDNPVLCAGTGTVKSLLALGVSMGMDALAE